MRSEGVEASAEKIWRIMTNINNYRDGDQLFQSTCLLGAMIS
jgi:hypothetical protein